MRTACLLSMLGVLAGCGVDQDPSGPTTQSAPSVPAAEQTGQVAQHAQFADATVINEVQLQSNGMSLLIDADGSPLTLQVFYVGDKTTDSGRTAAAPVLRHTISMDTDQTAKIDINLADPAFAGNYGAIFIDAIGSDPLLTSRRTSSPGSTSGRQGAAPSVAVVFEFRIGRIVPESSRRSPT